MTQKQAESLPYFSISQNCILAENLDSFSLLLEKKAEVPMEWCEFFQVVQSFLVSLSLPRKFFELNKLRLLPAIFCTGNSSFSKHLLQECETGKVWKEEQTLCHCTGRVAEMSGQRRNETSFFVASPTSKWIEKGSASEKIKLYHRQQNKWYLHVSISLISVRKC